METERAATQGGKRRRRVSAISQRESTNERLLLLQSAFQGELTWSEAICRMRMSLGKTQAEFCELFGITRRHLIELEAGTANPGVKTLDRLGRPFGLTVGYIPRAGLKRPTPELLATRNPSTAK
jgi:DNA-binding XRE family transcriptional regulator